MSGSIFVITAPSGAGKTTLVRMLVEHDSRLVESVSHTTRQIREGEKCGTDYHFVTPDEFEQIASNDGFVESFSVFGNSYGTSKKELERITSANKNALLILDCKGAYKMKEIYGDKVTTIFILPPSIEELEVRLRQRNTDSEDIIQTRLKEATAEIAQSKNFDKTVINSDLTTAFDELYRLVK